MLAGADHQRHEVDAERLHHRHGEQEHHHRAVHREDLVVRVRPEEVVVGPRQLHAASAPRARRRARRTRTPSRCSAGRSLAIDVGSPAVEPADQPGLLRRQVCSSCTADVSAIGPVLACAADRAAVRLLRRRSRRRSIEDDSLQALQVGQQHLQVARRTCCSGACRRPA